MLEELEAVGDLICGVDVERGAVFFGEGGEAGSIAVQGAVAVGERAWVCLLRGSLVWHLYFIVPLFSMRLRRMGLTKFGPVE